MTTWWRRPSLREALERSHQRTVECLAIINQEIRDTRMDITRLTQEVAETKGAVESAVKLIKDTAHAIRQYKTDQVALDKLADDLDASQRELAEAVVEVNAQPAPGGEVSTGGDQAQPTPLTGFGEDENDR